mgnify:CR=1 FL=1
MTPIIESNWAVLALLLGAIAIMALCCMWLERDEDES